VRSLWRGRRPNESATILRNIKWLVALARHQAKWRY
jgi:hypothetical protein